MCDYLGFSCYSPFYIPIDFLQTLYNEMITLQLAIFSKEFQSEQFGKNIIVTCIDIYGITDSVFVKQAFLPNIRYLVIVTGEGLYDILYLQIQLNRVLYASSTQINVQEVTTLSVRNAYYFIYNDIYFPLQYKVTNINKLQEFKEAISSLYNFDSIDLVVNGVLLFQLVIITYGFDQEGFAQSLLRLMNINTRTEPNKFESIFLFDLAKGALVSIFDDNPVFVWNSQYFYTCNNYLYLEYSSSLTLVSGGKKTFVLEPESSNLAKTSNYQELQQLLSELQGDLIRYVPLNTFFPFVCLPFIGTYYLYGFIALNDPLNFATILNVSTALSNQSNFFYVQVPSFFIMERPPEEPIFNFEGLEIYLNPNSYFLIYEPTFFVPFLEKYGGKFLSISDIKVQF